MAHRILIVEDEPMIAQDLKIILQFEGYEVIGPFSDAAAAIHATKSNAPDLALLDININGTLDGIALAEKLEQQFPYIFITSYYDEATLRRVENASPYAYIIKPFKEEEVLMNVKLALAKSEKQEKVITRKITVRENGVSFTVNTSAIAIARGEDNYTRLILTNGDNHLLSQTLKAVLNDLDPTQFARIHKSHAVNLNLVDGIAGKVVFVNGESLAIGRAYRKGFMSRI